MFGSILLCIKLRRKGRIYFRRKSSFCFYTSSPSPSAYPSIAPQRYLHPIDITDSGASIYPSSFVPVKASAQHLHATTLQRLLDTVIHTVGLLAVCEATVDIGRNCLCAGAGCEDECITLLPWNNPRDNHRMWPGTSHPNGCPHYPSPGISRF